MLEIQQVKGELLQLLQPLEIWMKTDQVILDMKMYIILVEVELFIISILILEMVFLEENKVIKA